MIPKVIHYCWFGGNPKSEFINKCMKSWEKYCPDYKIIEWNENNFDISMNLYVKEAYENRKWAFVSDFVRLFVLAKYGGFYLDTDVELVKSLDAFINYPAFTGYESKNFIPTAVMGAEKGNEWITYLLTYYDNRHFVLEDGQLDMTTNVVSITDMTKKKYSIEFENRKFEIPGTVCIFPKDYFAPKSPGERKYVITQNTVGIHHFDGSWMEGNRRINRVKMRYSKYLCLIKKILCAVIGEKNFDRLRGR